MKVRLVLAALLLVACTEMPPTPASTAPPTPTPSPAPEVAPAAAPDVSDASAVCATYYDVAARAALEDAERGAAEHPGVTVRSSLGTGERAAFIAACSTQTPERLRCFTAYAGDHVDECMPVIVTPTPEMAALVPLENQTVEDLRALVATLPPE